MRAPLLAALLVGATLAGCLSPAQPLDDAGLGLAQAYDTSRGWSMPLSPALHKVLDAVKQRVPAADEVPLAIGIFLPAMADCDWNATALPATCKLPAVMDAGPYYGPNVDRDKYRPPTVEWLVPRGYAVVQMSLRGTGESGGCYDFKSPRDAEDISAVIDWLAAQPWSNGNVGMIGRSYDGTTAWDGAASGNPHLKTIVPISGAVDAPGLYYKNGTSENRGPLHGTTYWPSYGLGTGDGGDPARRVTEWPANVCQATVDPFVQGPEATATGDASAAYWQTRDLRPAILEKYAGSVWVIHGLEDWNVNPSQAVPWIQQMQDDGLDVRAWLGVWGHAYPDRIDEHRNVRWDWAEQTVRWFDFWLQGKGPKPWLGVEVEDSLYVWRAEESYPPRDATLRPFTLGADGALAEGSGQAGSFLLATSAAGAPRLPSFGPGGQEIAFVSEPLARDLRIAGLPQVHITAAPTAPSGGQLFAELFDVYPDGRTVRIGWGGISLRFANGGNTEAVPLTPGQAVLAQLQMEPVDAHVGQGHRLQLVLHRAGVEDVMGDPSPAPIELRLGADSVLRVPEVQRPSIVPTYTPPGMAKP